MFKKGGEKVAVGITLKDDLGYAKRKKRKDPNGYFDQKGQGAPGILITF